MNNLQSGWIHANIKTLIGPDGILSDGDWVESKDQDPTGSIRLLQLADIGDGKFLDKSRRYINESKFCSLRCSEVFEGDLLVARMPDPLGRSCILPKLSQRCITVVDVAIVRPTNKLVIPQWLMYFLNSPETRQTIELLSSGTTRKRISRSNLSQIDIPIPPLNEQNRIADKLDTLLAKVDACREHLERVPDILKHFRQSVLAAATSGKLTEEWRKEHDIIINWKKVNLAECFDIFSGYGFKKNQYSNVGSRLLQIANVGYGYTIWEEENFIPIETANTDYKNFKLKPDDIVMALNRPITNNSLKVARLSYKDIPSTLYQRVACLRQNINANEQFIFLSLRTDEFLLQVKNNLIGSDQPYINSSSLNYLEINIPSLEEQHEIVRRVEILFAYADKLETRYQAARSRVDSLTPSLLAKAFRGELVPQDANDEAAAVLLERIRDSKGLPPDL